MFFIILLGLSAVALAGSAAYFSVAGLAVTFSGAFWGVVMMGGAVEAGKLMAASYLHRYWKETAFLMKTYLICGIIVVMTMTSAGIFGYLSAGYQAGMLPMKIIKEQIDNVEQERAKLTARKVEVDELLVDANRTAEINLNTSAGRIDARAVNTLKQLEESRQSKVAAIEPERQFLNDRIRTLDAEILDMKKQALEHEANIGPIMYIAEVFKVEPEQAAKYLIFLIIFAFDPMAIALTLAVNTALRTRATNKTTAITSATEPGEIISQPQPEPYASAYTCHVSSPVVEPIGQTVPFAEPSSPPPEPFVEPVTSQPPEADNDTEPAPSSSTDVKFVELEPVSRPLTKNVRFTSTLADMDDPEVIVDKLEWYHSTMDRVRDGEHIDRDTKMELDIIERTMASTGYAGLLLNRAAYDDFKRRLDGISPS